MTLSNTIKKLKKVKVKLGVFVIFLSFLMFVFFYSTRLHGQSADGSELDYGLVWYGRNSLSQKAKAGEPNPYFDRTKPTVIFIHGWMPDQAGEPPIFMVDFPAQDPNATYTLDLAAAWVDTGWNIGIFYWHPFSDEDLVWVAEDKIWTAQEQAGMRYRDPRGTYHTAGIPAVSVTELLVESYLENLKDFTGPEIRIAGHSLGNRAGC